MAIKTVDLGKVVGPQGNPTTVNGKSGAEITLTTDDIKSPGGESVSASLSKKVNKQRISVAEADSTTLPAGIYEISGEPKTILGTTLQFWTVYVGDFTTEGGLVSATQMWLSFQFGQPTQIFVRQADSTTSWGDFVELATATPPEEHALPLAAGLLCTSKSWYERDQFDKVRVHGAISGVGSVTWNNLLATLPVGCRAYEPIETSMTYQKTDKSFAAGVVATNSSGEIRVFPTNGDVGDIVYFELEFYAPTDPIAQQSTPVRMLAPMSRMARSVTSKEPEKRLMCVVDAGGAYVEFVEVTVTYDDDWQTIGALFTPYCYALKDGEALVDSDRPPHMRVHAGGDGLIAPVWDLGGKVWLESATAEEIAVWELEHLDTGKTPEAVRAQRDMLLSDTDKYAVLDAPISAETRAALYTYRQDLRDVPEQAGFPNAVIWPQLPAITKAAPDPVDTAFDMMTGGEGNA